MTAGKTVSRIKTESPTERSEKMKKILTVEDLDFAIKYTTQEEIEGEELPQYEEIKKSIPAAIRLLENKTINKEERAFLERMLNLLNGFNKILSRYTYNLHPYYPDGTPKGVISDVEQIYVKGMFFLISTNRYFTDYTGNCNHYAVVASSSYYINVTVEVPGSVERHTIGSVTL